MGIINENNLERRREFSIHEEDFFELHNKDGEKDKHIEDGSVVHVKIMGTRKRRHHPYKGRKDNKNNSKKNNITVAKDTNPSLAGYDTATDRLVNLLEKLTKYKKD